eukprot:1684373-Alexandrium_andersonii.AAC.1
MRLGFFSPIGCCGMKPRWDSTRHDHIDRLLLRTRPGFREGDFAAWKDGSLALQPVALPLKGACPWASPLAPQPGGHHQGQGGFAFSCPAN